ncbi:hypothetical protein COLINT_03643 [Collinsella intestinalis DSM 13280]|uniref:Uncharacterized protein n=1 Tax=Collinsella intestinalis DSM 13280 TaxID=521003 RepID=C4FC24_9ACTN|nr:hypothetical protein COLINT_03643 [Collinsella intestinalis DSM 13280]
MCSPAHCFCPRQNAHICIRIVCDCTGFLHGRPKLPMGIRYMAGVKKKTSIGKCPGPWIMIQARE